MRNPFRTLTLSEKLSILEKDAIDELIHAKLTLHSAKSRVALAEAKLAEIRALTRTHAGGNLGRASILRAPGKSGDSGSLAESLRGIHQLPGATLGELSNPANRHAS